jgi:polyisoprenoid-binding protein YceI
MTQLTQQDRTPQKAGPDMAVHYRMDSEHSHFAVQAFAGGLLSFVAHSPTFTVRQFAGHLEWEPEKKECRACEVVVKAGSLELADTVRPVDRVEIETRMRQEVLDVNTFPETRFQGIEFAASAVAADRFRLRITGEMALHGVSQREVIAAELQMYDDGIRLAGKHPLRLSDYRIRPVTALAGAIQLRDQLELTFDIVGWKEAT